MPKKSCSSSKQRGESVKLGSEEGSVENNRRYKEELTKLARELTAKSKRVRPSREEKAGRWEEAFGETEEKY